MIRVNTSENINCLLTTNVLDCNTAFDLCKHESAGDVVLFCGTTRDHYLNQTVTQLSYTCYPDLCISEMVKIANECLLNKGIYKVYIAHRIDTVLPKEISIICGISSEHREEGYNVCKWLLDECKKRLPIWKLEEYKQGGSEWKENIIK